MHHEFKSHLQVTFWNNYFIFNERKYSTFLSLSFCSTTHKMPVFPILANFKAESFAHWFKLRYNFTISCHSSLKLMGKMALCLFQHNWEWRPRDRPHGTYI